MSSQGLSRTNAIHVRVRRPTTGAKRQDSAEVVETAFCTFALSRIAGEIASILDLFPCRPAAFSGTGKPHVDFLKWIIKATVTKQPRWMN
ncbi:terminase small subunit [Escherichia coli]